MARAGAARRGGAVVHGQGCGPGHDIRTYNHAFTYILRVLKVDEHVRGTDATHAGTQTLPPPGGTAYTLTAREPPTGEYV